MLNSRAEVASMTPEPFVSCSKGPAVLEVKAHLMRVLIAEDDPALASFVHKGLEAEHYAVDVTTDGEQARAMAGELDYDLLNPGFEPSARGRSHHSAASSQPQA